MRAYIVSRLGQTALVLFLSLTAVFAMSRLSGDPVLLFMPMDIQAKDVNEFRQRLGFNDPVPVQYARFVAAAARGDFGESLRYRQGAMGLVLARLPATLLLGGTSLLLTLAVAVPLGVLTAVRRDGLLDHVGTISTVLGQATPGFWLGLMLIYVFSVQLRWLPTRSTSGVAPLLMPSLELTTGLPGRRLAATPQTPAVSRARRSSQLKKWLGLGFTLTALLAALGAPWLAAHDPLRTDFAQSLKPPGAAGHVLGTDQLGRDLFARVLHGARLALFIGGCTVVLTALVGGALGLVAGFAERWPSAVLVRIPDVQLSFPFILLAMTINAIVGLGLRNIILSLWRPDG